MRMRISKFEARQTMYFEKEMHYRFRFSNTDEKLITTRHRIPVNAPCHPPPRVFFLFHPPSLPRPIPFSYIFDALCLDAARYKSHYLRIVGSGTRLRGQRDTVDFPLPLPFLIPIDSQTQPDMFSSMNSRDLARDRRLRLFRNDRRRVQESGYFRLD